MSQANYQAALRAAIEAAREAGNLLRGAFHRLEGPIDIDHDVDALLRARLTASFPWNYLGEEIGFEAGDDPSHCWVVDPNDGTTEYRRGRRGSAVSIAAIHGGQPVLGVVFAFVWPDDDGDLIAWAEGCGPVHRNGQPAPALVDTNLDDPELRFHEGLVVYLSPGAEARPVANSHCLAPARFAVRPSLDHRLAIVGAGDGIGALSPTNPFSWDVAAGHAILRGGGGVLLDYAGHPIVYAPDGLARITGAFGGTPRVADTLRVRDWRKVMIAPEVAPPSPFGLARPPLGQAVRDARLLSRAQGCLLGQFAGDALGGLVEFTSPEVIASRYPHGVRTMHDGGTWKNLAGQPTDDSEMALMLARSLVKNGRYEPGLALDAYCHWWPKAWDRGGTLAQALGPACLGQTTRERLQLAMKHANPERPSNGCMMRLSPAGIFAAGRPEAAAAIARQDSRLTHPHPVCADACAAYAAAVAAAIASGDRETAYATALAETRKPGTQPEALQAVEAARHVPPADYITQQGWVLIALQNALYQLLHAASVEEGIVDTIGRGGDTDTTAAIAGALLGACQGREALPAGWRRTLSCCRPVAGMPTQHTTPPELWPVDALELAEAVLAAGMSTSQRS
jgi:ADP-ribosylglycohydrolase/fructose-1,6-bisphosphatase/inositol monophosphatase family enzyme